MKQYIVNTFSVALLLSIPHIMQAGKKNKNHGPSHESSLSAGSMMPLDTLKAQEQSLIAEIDRVEVSTKDLSKQQDATKIRMLKLTSDSSKKYSTAEDDSLLISTANSLQQLQLLEQSTATHIKDNEDLLASHKEAIAALVIRMQLLEPAERPDSFESLLKSIREGAQNQQLQHAETVVSHQPINELELEKTVLFLKSIRDAAQKRTLQHVETTVSNQLVNVSNLETALFASLLANIRSERKKRNLHAVIPAVKNQPILTTDVPTDYYMKFDETLKQIHKIDTAHKDYESILRDAEEKSSPTVPTTAEYIAESQLTLLQKTYAALREDYAQLTQSSAETSETVNPVFNKKTDDFENVDASSNDNNNVHPTAGSSWSLWPFASTKK